MKFPTEATDRAFMLKGSARTPQAYEFKGCEHAKQLEIDDADSRKVQEDDKDTIRQLRRERDDARAQVYHYQSDPLDKRTARYERTIIAQAQRIADLEQEKAR